MTNFEDLRKEFDDFLTEHDGNMTDDAVIQKAIDTEDKLFERKEYI